MKKSNIIVGLVVVMVLFGGVGWWAFGSEASGKGNAVVPVPTVTEQPSSVNNQKGSTTEGFKGDITGGFVASKNGSKYFPVSCGSAKTINEENKVFFQSTSEAESAGYTPAKNC